LEKRSTRRPEIKMKHLNRLDHPIIDSSTAVSSDLSAIGTGQLALVRTFWPGRLVVEVVVLQVSNADKFVAERLS
jgi:hypothetical protein